MERARITRVYGKANVLLAAIAPFAVLFASTLSVRPPIEPDARIMENAERDGQRLAAQGYRVVTSDWYELPLFGFHFMRVTYEANEDKRA